MSTPVIRRGRLVILGVAASDVHVVANQLIATMLREHGLFVVNLGVCTPVEEFAAACDAHPEAEAVLIGSLNGHALEDLQGLHELRRARRIHCPVVLGGNLSVGSHKKGGLVDRLRALGVDHVLESAEELPVLLDSLAATSRQLLVQR